MKKVFYKFGRSILAATLLGAMYLPDLHAQDVAVVPANNNTQIPFENGGALGSITVLPQASAELNWNSGSLPNIVGGTVGGTIWASTNTVQKTTGGLFGSDQTFTGQTISLSNGQTFCTLPFTGYYVGVKIGRTKEGGGTSGGSYRTDDANDVVILSTYLGGVLQESENIHWGGSATTNEQTYDLGFYAHKPFDEVRITPKSRMGSLISQTAKQTYRLDKVYFQRYTRFGGGVSTTGTEQATCNAPIPLTGRGLTAQGSATSLGIPPYYVPALPSWLESMIDDDPTTHAVVPHIGILSVLSNYQGSVKDLAVVYPAGTFAGFKISFANGFTASALDSRTISLWRNGVAVGSSMTTGLLGSAILNTDGSVTLGMIAPAEFDEIKYEITTAFTPAGVSLVTVEYPVIQRFCDVPVVCTTPPVPVSLSQGVQNGDINYPVVAKAIVPLSIGTINATIKDLNNVVDNNPNNYAEISQLVGGLTEYGISVISQETNGYSAGMFAGFEIEDVNLGSGSFAVRHLVRTYKNGVATGDEYDDGGSLASLKFLANSGRYQIGMKTTQDFDEVRIAIQSAGSVGVYATRVFGAILEPFCKSNITPDCNQLTQLNRNNFPVYIDGKHTGTNGNSVGTLNHYFQNLNNIIDVDNNNYASLITTAGASTTASVAIQDGSKGIAGPDFELYPAGTFAGFDVSFPSVLGGGFLNNVSVSTLSPNGTVLETFNMSGSLMSIHSGLLTGGMSRQMIGFVANQPFSGVKFTATKAVSANWGEIRIYGAAIQSFCASPVISCDEIEKLNAPDHPLYINGKRTGIAAAFDGNSVINNSQFAIDNDNNSYAELQLGVSVGSSLGFSVANGFDSYAANTYVGFDIGSQNWFEMNGFYSTKIELYNNGVLVQTSTGDQIGGGVSSSIVSGGWQRNIMGTVAHVEFDEARLLIQRLAGASLGGLRIYNFVARDFTNTSACAITSIKCDNTYVLTDNNGAGNTLPATIEFANTGYTGALSAGYGIDDVWNVVSPSNADYATIHLPASGGTNGSISVSAPGVVFPAGTFAGYSVEKQNFIISGGLFTGVTVTTYLNGQLQETKTNSALADFTLLTQWFGTPANFYTPGFKTTLPFNEVKISIGGLVSVLDQTLKVYGAYIDTRESAPVTGDGSTLLKCGADLTPTTFLPISLFSVSNSTSRNLIVDISEIIGKSTDNTNTPVSVMIPKESNFDYTFNSAATTLGGINVNNADWELVANTSSFMQFRLKSHLEISAYSRSRIGINITVKQTATTGDKSMTITVPNGSGGDINDNNNTTIRQVIIND